jgi:hypothetical protein
MNRPMDAINQASVYEALDRRAHRDHGVCVYLRAEEECACDIKPRCPHWLSSGLCRDHGDCGGFCLVYAQPPGMRNSFALEVDA